MISTETLGLFVDHYTALMGQGRSSVANIGTLGLVVNTDDPLQQGRLQVFCPALNDNPKKIQHLPWTAYVSPFGGSINHKEYARGVGQEGDYGSDGAVHYGFWAIPEVGAHVLVGCVDGDSRRRVWMGCLPEHQETQTMLGGRFDWSGPNGTPDGPFTSNRKPIQPLYDNMTAAFGDRKSSEWKTRGADYQAAAILSSEGQAPNKQKGPDSLDGDYDDIARYEEDEWVKERLGAHGYDWSGFKDLGAMKSSRVFGFGTPGMHFISMDDRPFNSRMKFQSQTGHMILMDDTNERIYIKTNKGNNWVEMDSNGNIDVYSSQRISISSDNDINLSSKGTLRMYAGESIHMYAGHNLLSGEENSAGTLLEEPAIKGEIRIQAEADHHVIARNVRQKSHENTYHESGINKYENVGESAFMTVEKDHNLSTNTGDILSASGRHVSSTAKVDMKHFAEGKGSFAAVSDTELHSFDGTLSASSNGPTVIKSATDNVDIQASSHSGTGSVTVKAPDSQTKVGNGGISSATSGTITHTSAGDNSTVVDGSTTVSGLSGIINGELMSGSGAANIVKVSTSNISLHSALGDIIHKTSTRGHSYDVLTNKVDELTTSLDKTIYQTNQISQSIGTAIAALSGSYSIPFSFDIGCLTQALYNALPQGILDVFATFSELQAALANLGHVVNSIEQAIALLEGNIALLSSLGLPNISFNLSLTSSACVQKMPLFTGTITIPPALTLVPIQLRSLIHKIYENGATWGPLPTKPTLPTPTPCPLTPAPPSETAP